MGVTRISAAHFIVTIVRLRLYGAHGGSPKKNRILPWRITRTWKALRLIEEILKMLLSSSDRGLERQVLLPFAITFCIGNPRTCHQLEESYFSTIAQEPQVCMKSFLTTTFVLLTPISFIQ